MGGSGDKKSMSAAHGTSFLVHLVNGHNFYMAKGRDRETTSNNSVRTFRLKERPPLQFAL